jgi:CubicO group peptidase (beta-lactamase class C family)
MTPSRLLVALLAAPVPVTAQAPAEWHEAVERFDRFVREDSIVGGALIYLHREHGAEHYVGFGNRTDTSRAGRSSMHTFWHWGSITKTVTAIAVMRLVQQGALALDDPAVAWLPELRRIHNRHGTMDQVTVRMLLAHSSGLQAGTWPWTRGRDWEPFEPSEWNQLVAMMPYMELGFPPGSRYGYSNPAFIYLARIIEAISGEHWQSHVHKQVLLPLQLHETYFGTTPWPFAAVRAHNYSLTRDGVRDHGADFDPGITIPNGGWNARAGDIGAWLQFLMGSDEPATSAWFERLLPHATIESMWQPVVRVSDEEEMGLSFFLRHERGRRLVGHTGTQAHFRSFFWMDPAARTAVIGVVNTSNDVDPEASARGWREVMAVARSVLGT